MRKRIVSLLLAVVMVLSLMPLNVFATEPETYSVRFQGHSVQLNTFKLYTYTEGVKGEADLLEGVADSDDSNTQLYAAELAAGDYWVEGYAAAGDCSGGIKITVTAEEEQTFEILRAYQIYASNSGWVLGTDYSVSALVQNQDKTVTREVVMGTAKDYSGNDLPSVLCLKGDTVKITYTPSEAKQAENYIETFKSATMTANSSSWSVSIPQAVAVSFQVPNGAVVDAGRFHDYYVYDFAEPKTVSTPEEGDWTYTYMIPKSTDWFYRVSYEDGVTYWNFARWTADATVTISSDDLYIGSTEFTKDTIFRYDHNVYDRADIYLNINGMGHLTMEEGGHYQLNVFRNWMAIESYMNAKVALPDMTYTVIDAEGNPSDLLTIVPDENNSSVAMMTANGEGTAIVLVTYDAMTHMVGQTSTGSDRRFSAIWPECTGVFVVTVGEEAGIETNMMIERYEAEDTAIDAEHDILFYLGDAGAEYSFTPESGCTVTVDRAVIEDGALTYTGFTAEGVTTDEDGTVTVSGLTSGRHIVKIEKDGQAVYQVITARAVSYELQDAEGNALTEDSVLKAGDTVYLQFNNLVNPAEKLSGAYNFNASIYYQGEDGTYFRSNPGSNFGVYDFSGNPVRQKIAITIPKYWPDLSYTLAGAIKMGGFGNVSVGGHRGVTYASGLNPNFNASTVGMILSRMPEVTFTLAETNFLTGKISFQDDSGNVIERASLTVTMEDSDGNAVQVAEDGSFKCLPETYSYVISGTGVEYTTGSVTITEDGTNEFIVTLNATSDAAWDGTSASEPAQDENGVYLISNGAELKWFANEVSTTNTISGILTADIDLANYPWTAIASFTGTFDGDGHTITNLNVTAAAQNQGLFARVNSGGMVKNLTLDGSVTNTNNYSGAVVGYLYYGTVENVVSEVTISGSNYTGGIAGYSYGGTIRNCANLGAVNGNGYTAGIVGNVSGSTVVSDSYNAAAITGQTTYIGGIVGDASNTAISVTACYNTGAVSGSNYVGGVIARTTGASAVLSDCYNAGTVTATGTAVGGFVGDYSNASVVRCYTLEGTTDPVAAVLTAARLKDAHLDEEHYGKVCGGYPALLWQNVTFHTIPESGTVTEPDCTTGGYTAYVCASCGEGFTADYADALGHDWCEDLAGCDDCANTAPTCTEAGSAVRNCRFPGCEEVRTDVIPVTGHTEDESQTIPGTYYKSCVCAVCGESYTVYDDARMAHMTLDESTINTVAVGDNTYPWGWDADQSRFESSNVGVNSSASATTITLNLLHSANVAFNYGVSSENNYDKLTITAVVGGQTVTIANAISGSTTGAFAQELPAGEYTLTFSFTKDGSSASGEDIGWVSDLSVTATHAVSYVENAAEEYLAAPATCVDAARYYVSCEVCGEMGTETFTYGEPVSDAHSYTESVVEASCGVEGYTAHTCGLCGHNYRDSFVPALEHEYESVVTDPTYESGGYTTHTCVNCGDSYVDAVTDPLVLNRVNVYLSISHDDKFSVGGETDEVVALRDIEVPYFDLALYGLEEFYFVSEDYGSGSGEIGDNTYYGQEPYENKVTMLHLYIYATEVFYFGLDENEAGKGWLYDEGHLNTGVLSIGGSSGSLFLNDFWNGSMNLNYYRNYEYPLASSGWGATADQILLHDGDIVTLGAFTSWNFFSDSSSIFNYIVADGDLVTTEAVQGESLSLQVMHAGANMGMGTALPRLPSPASPMCMSLPWTSCPAATSPNGPGSAPPTRTVS